MDRTDAHVAGGELRCRPQPFPSAPKEKSPNESTGSKTSLPRRIFCTCGIPIPSLRSSGGHFFQFSKISDKIFSLCWQGKNQESKKNVDSFTLDSTLSHGFSMLATVIGEGTTSGNQDILEPGGYRTSSKLLNARGRKRDPQP